MTQTPSSETKGAAPRGGPFAGPASPANTPLFSLLELDGGAGLFQSRLGLLGLFAGHPFLDGVGRAVNEVLRLLETEVRELAHGLDHLDLLRAGLREDDVERC